MKVNFYSQSQKGLRWSESFVKSTLIVSRRLGNLQNIFASDTFVIRIGFIVIYMNKVFDLLETNEKECGIRLPPNSKNYMIPNQTLNVAKNVQQVLECFERANKSVASTATIKNKQSSRSHGIFQNFIKSQDIQTKQAMVYS